MSDIALQDEYNQVDEDNNPITMDVSAHCFISKDELLLCKNNQLQTLISQLSDEDAVQLIELRMKCHFGMKTECNFSVIEQIPIKNPNIYQSRDVFEYLYYCQYQKKLDITKPLPLASSTTPTRLERPGQLTMSITTTQNLIQQQYFNKQLFIYKSQAYIVDGIHKLESTTCNVQHYLGYTIYYSDTIEKAIQRCGWGTGQVHPYSVNEVCTKMEGQQQYYRSSAIALFHFDFVRSQQAIKLIPHPDHQVKTMTSALHALSCLLKHTYEIQQLLYAKSPSDTTEPMQSKLKLELLYKNLEITRQVLRESEFTNEYIKLMAQFIIKDNFAEYLIQNVQNSGISIFDRVGLWHRFLTPQQIETIKLPTNLDSIILHGRCEDSVKALQDYLEQTGDIQMVGTIAAHLYFLDYPKHQQLAYMFYQYSELLLRLQLYNYRATLLCEVYNLESFYSKQLLAQLEQFEPTKPGKVALACSYCRKGLGQANLEQQRRNPMKRSQIRDDNPRTYVCPMCNALLPKCVICVAHFTIPNQSDQSQMRRGPTQPKQKDYLSIQQAMVWCASCRHGGHQGHLEDWFTKYSKCPVADCGCECATI